MTRLRLGVLSYVNCLPVTMALETGRVKDSRLALRKGNPTQLNRLMFEGQLDVSLVSTAEYLEHRKLYRRLPAFSLWSDGWVESVSFYSRFDRAELSAAELVLAVTPESKTSVALLELLLPRAKTVPYTSLDEVREGIASAKLGGVLLIGDEALQPPAWVCDLKRHDLGQWWKDVSGLPMTFAVWVARACLEEDALMLATRLLEESREWGLGLEPELLREGNRRCGIGLDRLKRYYQNLRYETTIRSAEGLLDFGARLALKKLELGAPALVGL